MSIPGSLDLEDAIVLALAKRAECGVVISGH